MSTRLTGISALNYTGVQPSSPPNYVQYDFDPTIQSQNFFLGDMWLNKQTLNVWMLVRQRTVNGTPTGTWVKFAGAAGAITQITTNGGIVILPNAGNVNIVGDGTSITITGNPATNTATVSITGSVNHAVAVGNAASTLNYLPVGTTNTVLLGNTGADPSWGAVPNAALAHSSVTLNNGNNITITGSPVALGAAATIAVSGTTNHAVQIGNGTGSLSSVAVGATNQILSGNTGADPSWSTLTAGTGINITIGGGLTTITNTGATYGSGSFTPTLQFGGASTGIVYTTQIGEYTQVGNLIFVIINLTITSKGSSTGVATVAGLPFAVNGLGAGGSTDGILNVDFGITTTAGYDTTWALFVGGSTTIQYRQGSTTGAPASTTIPDTAFSNAMHCLIQGFYYTS